MNKTRGLLFTAGIVLATAFTLSCEEKNADKPSAAEPAVPDKRETFTDSRDGKAYKMVKIGEQTWMAENLNYKVEGSKCFGEGGEVVFRWERNESEETQTLSSSEVQANCAKYGRLYDWETAKKACPSGWHLPTKADWEILTKTVGGEQTEGKKLKATSGWNKNGNGTDEFGFSALPGGDGRPNGYFYGAGDYGDWWKFHEKIFV